MLMHLLGISKRAVMIRHSPLRVEFASMLMHVLWCCRFSGVPSDRAGPVRLGGYGKQRRSA